MFLVVANTHNTKITILTIVKYTVLWLLVHAQCCVSSSSVHPALSSSSQTEALDPLNSFHLPRPPGPAGHHCILSLSEFDRSKHLIVALRGSVPGLGRIPMKPVKLK